MTWTRSPAAIGCGDVARQISPCTAICPVAPGAIAVSATPDGAAHAFRAGHGRPPLRRQRQPAEEQEDRREPERDRQHEPQAERDVRACRASASSSRAPGCTAPPMPSAPKLGTFSSSTSSPRPNTISSNPAAFTGSTWNAKNASSRDTPPDDARQHEARVPHLDRQAEQPQAHQDVRDLRMRDRAQQALPRASSPRARRARPRCRSVDGAPVEARRPCGHRACAARSSTSVATRSMSGGAAASASRSVNARLCVTASAASATLRCRASASDRA